ncbi:MULTISPECIES: glycosyltransferase family 2 protein [unclassified Paenibacillus]|uniref:glycosyltransferase family 2 protein n=1 Tax=unclassified Paenibacillus TaxID=185978 RepID=UPI001914FAD2|nr:glycosyltransferase [Paenibacillus sp. EPM92]
MSKTSIIIPVHMAKELLGKCIASIRNHTDIPYEIIVIDNGSNDGTDEYCRKERITFVSLPWKHAVSDACNLGLRLSTGENLLLLKHDVLASRNWLSGMLQGLNSQDDIGIVRPSLIPIQIHLNKHVADEDVLERCILFKRDLLNKIGFLQTPQLFADRVFHDYCSRASQAGYLLMIAGKVKLNPDSTIERVAAHTP